MCEEKNIMFLSKRVQAIQPSPTLAIDAKAKKIERAGDRRYQFRYGRA